VALQTHWTFPVARRLSSSLLVVLTVQFLRLVSMVTQQLVQQQISSQHQKVCKQDGDKIFCLSFIELVGLE